jgi:hypothetical protein
LFQPVQVKRLDHAAIKIPDVLAIRQFAVTGETAGPDNVQHPTGVVAAKCEEDPAVVLAYVAGAAKNAGWNAEYVARLPGLFVGFHQHVTPLEGVVAKIDSSGGRTPAILNS